MPLWPGGEAPSYPNAKTIGGSLTVGGQILAADGAASAPSITFLGGSNTGFYRAGSNQLGISIGGGVTAYFEIGAFSIDRNAVLNWSDGNGLSGSGRDLRLSRIGLGQLGIGPGNGGNGQQFGVKLLTELTTIAAAATTDTAIQIPANALVMGVTARVTVQPPGTTTTDVGVAGATTRYGTGISTAVAITTPGTIDGIRYYGSAISIRYTPNTTPSDATGRIRTTIHYFDLTPATS